MKRVLTEYSKGKGKAVQGENGKSTVGPEMASFWKSEGLGLHTKKPYQTYDWRGKGTEYIPFLVSEEF